VKINLRKRKINFANRERNLHNVLCILQNIKYIILCLLINKYYQKILSAAPATSFLNAFYGTKSTFPDSDLSHIPYFLPRLIFQSEILAEFKDKKYSSKKYFTSILDLPC